MTLKDALYRLGDAIGWDHCDYARDRDGRIYGVTDGTTTLGLTLDDGAVYWQASCRCDGAAEHLDDGACPVGDTRALLAAWQRATILTDDGEAA